VLGSRRRLVTAVVSAAAALAIAVAVYGRGCSADDDSAEAVALRFLTASRAGNAELMYELMNEETQRALEVAAHKATELVGGSRRFEAVDMISVSAAADPRPPKITVSERGDARVIFAVAGEPGEPDASLAMVFEDGQWRVDAQAYREAAGGS